MLRTVRRPSRVHLSFSLSSLPLISVNRRAQLSSGTREPLDKDSSKQQQHDILVEQSQSYDGKQPPSPMPVMVDVDAVKGRVYEWTTRNASALRHCMDDFSETARIAFTQLGGRLNEVTGYHEIEALKNLVAENERKMHDIREAGRIAKTLYEDAVARRSSSQRELNDLLQRKSSWNDADVLRFTELVRTDHAHELAEARARAAAADADGAVERQFGELMRTILARYHEEQVWSDKIRSASTYGSLAALGLNLIVFVFAIVLVEPWKRKKLVQKNGLRDLRMHQDSQEVFLEEIRIAQATLSKAAPAPAIASSEDNEEAFGVVSAIPSIGVDRSVNMARDRQMVALSVVGAMGAGVAGYLLGTWYG
ncbi:hypothetical protein EW145_g4407 [Phellinidium pouzarii]|uniref:Sensitive to high expression protein 9, mitochondrial n=1 Tax=Phellinidium pouzarii TaxID=167371 RepID=A0A4S4L510_9AGAM|nr:hypothetical protein EW145_g4407 [Phellinidium pouzarii]